MDDLYIFQPCRFWRKLNALVLQDNLILQIMFVAFSLHNICAGIACIWFLSHRYDEMCNLHNQFSLDCRDTLMRCLLFFTGTWNFLLKTLLLTDQRHRVAFNDSDSCEPIARTPTCSGCQGAHDLLFGDHAT
jgi:hypothetical protein